MNFTELAPGTQATVGALYDALITTWVLLDNDHKYTRVNHELVLFKGRISIFIELQHEYVKVYAYIPDIVPMGRPHRPHYERYFYYNFLDIGEVVNYMLTISTNLEDKEA